MSFYDFVSEATTYSGIPLALGGFGVTFWQLYKTKEAAAAAQEAAEGMRERLVRASLVPLLYQLAKTEEELERAIRDGEIELAITWVNSWRWQAGQTRGLLQSLGGDRQKVMKLLQASIAACGEAKNVLITGNGDLVADTTGLRTAISKATAEIPSLSADLGFTNGE